MKENSIKEDRINKAYCFLNSMHSDFRTGLYYKKDLENLEHILSDYKKLQEEFKQVDHECERLEEKEVRLIKENEELKSENRRLKVIRYSREYGTENIHLITKSDLVEINTNKYFIEIQDGKFVDLKQVYQENEELKKFITEGITVAPHSPYKNYRLDFLRENFVLKRRIKNEIAKMQEEFNQLDEKIELYFKKEEKTMQEFYENRDNVGELQMIAYFIQTLQELLESEDSKDGEN